MERSSKELLKYILDVNMEFFKIQETFEKEEFLKTTKIKIDISSDPVRLIIKAFDINDDEKGKEIFYIINDIYSRKLTTQEAINQIEKVLEN